MKVVNKDRAILCRPSFKCIKVLCSLPLILIFEVILITKSAPKENFSGAMELASGDIALAKFHGLNKGSCPQHSIIITKNKIILMTVVWFLDHHLGWIGGDQGMDRWFVTSMRNSDCSRLSILHLGRIYGGRDDVSCRWRYRPRMRIGVFKPPISFAWRPK